VEQIIAAYEAEQQAWWSQEESPPG
jgi:hypothetical protein